MRATDASQSWRVLRPVGAARAGLRTREDGERELRRDLELLLATVPRVAVTWQAMQDGEANLLAPELALLSTLHQLAWGASISRRAPLPARNEAMPDVGTAPTSTVWAHPGGARGTDSGARFGKWLRQPGRLPHRFFARHVLRLGEMDEVSEEMVKSDYGALVHRALERFHARVPVVSGGVDAALALAELRRLRGRGVAAAVEDNFLAIGWRWRWEKRLPAYLDWQREREAQGWRWSQAETKVKRLLPLDDGSTVELYGRIDRIDVATAGEGVSLLDYKTQTAKVIKDRLLDDVQLPAWRLATRRGARLMSRWMTSASLWCRRVTMKIL